jgi:hypothetical protein
MVNVKESIEEFLKIKGDLVIDNRSLLIAVSQINTIVYQRFR